MIYLYYGKDTYGLEKEIAKHTQKEGIELSLFENSNISELSLNLLTQSFFGGDRIFIVKNCLLKINSGNDDLIVKSLGNLPANTKVIFVEEKMPPISKTLKYIKSNGEIRKFEELKNINLVTFIKEKVTEEGGEIAPLAAERLSTYVGPDLWQLTEEIRKLVLYKKSDEEVEPIDTADVDLLVRANFEANIFGLMDAFAAKNPRRAAELINSFIDSGENEIYILTMIEKQFRNIAIAKFESNPTVDKLTKKAGLHPFVAGKSMQAARNFEKTEIIEIYRSLVDADLKLKSGFDPKQILLRLLV